MAYEKQSEGSKALDQREHNRDASAKRVLIRGFNSDSGEWENQPISGGKLVYEQFDYIGATYPNSTTEVYTYKLGGSGGTTVATLTVVYTDSTKDDISTVTRS